MCSLGKGAFSSNFFFRGIPGTSVPLVSMELNPIRPLLGPTEINALLLEVAGKPPVNCFSKQSLPPHLNADSHQTTRPPTAPSFPRFTLSKAVTCPSPSTTPLYPLFLHPAPFFHIGRRLAFCRSPGLAPFLTVGRRFFHELTFPSPRPNKPFTEGTSQC